MPPIHMIAFQKDETSKVLYYVTQECDQGMFYSEWFISLSDEPADGFQFKSYRAAENTIEELFRRYPGSDTIASAFITTFE